MSGILRTARAVFSLLSPMTGIQSTGTIPVTADSADVIIPRNTYLIPVNPAKSSHVLIKTTEVATATTAGVSIQIKTAFGGGAVNLPIGEILQWSPEIEGIPATVELTAAMAGGSASTGFGAVMSLVQYEQVGAGTAPQDIFKSKTNNTPALILCWDSSDGNAKASGDKRHMDENWVLFVVTSRLDRGAFRGHEGLHIMEEARELLTDRGAVDGERFSSPATILIKRCRRIATTNESYIYAIEFQSTRTLSKREAREFIPWTQTNEDMTTLAGTDPELPVVTGVSFSMT